MVVVNISDHPRFVQKRVPVKVLEKYVGKNNSAIRLLDYNDLHNEDPDLVGRFKRLVINNLGNVPGQIFEWNGYVGQVMEKRSRGTYTFFERKDCWLSEEDYRKW
jgi:hypothetical protein